MIMKIIVYLLISIIPISINAQTIRSYIENEIIGQSAQGPISEVPQHSGTWVEWTGIGDTITMMDGTTWEKSSSFDGNIHYRYVGTNGQPERFTQYIEAIFNADYTKMNIRYAFGPMGMSVQMVGKYSCLGDGKQPAEEWINMTDEK